MRSAATTILYATVVLAHAEYFLPKYTGESFHFMSDLVGKLARCLIDSSLKSLPIDRASLDNTITVRPDHLVTSCPRLRAVTLFLHSRSFIANSVLPWTSYQPERTLRRGPQPAQAENAWFGERILQEAEDLLERYQSKNLVEAAKLGDSRAADTFLESGSDPDESDMQGRTALNWAAGYGHLNVVESLLRARADTEKRDVAGNVPLHYAAAYGRCAVVHLLIEAGASSSVLNVQGMSPADVARMMPENSAMANESLMSRLEEGGDEFDERINDVLGNR